MSGPANPTNPASTSRSVYGLVLGVGVDKVPMDLQYLTGGRGFSAVLEQEADLGTAKALLESYGVKTDTWPAFVKDALGAKATLRRLEYKGEVVGTGDATKIEWNQSFQAHAPQGAKIEEAAGNVQLKDAAGA